MNSAPNRLRTRLAMTYRCCAATFALIVGANQAGADILTVNGPSQSSFSRGPWSVSGSVDPFNVPFARLNSVSCTIYAAAEIQQRFTNNGNFNIYPNINGRARVTVNMGGSLVGSAFLFPFGSGVIPPHSSGNVAGFDNQVVNAAMSTNPNPGFLTISADAGSGPSIQSLGSLQVNYNYTPIGLVQSDPILQTSVSHNIFTFAGVPSGRWFDPITATGYRYDMISAGDSFTNILSLPTGFGSTMHVTVNGVDVGPLSGGASLSLPNGVRSFTVYNIDPPFNAGDPIGFPIQLGFNRSGVTFTATPVPTPGTTALLSLSMLAFCSRSRKSVCKASLSRV